MTLEELNKRIEEEYDQLVQEGLDWSIENDENEHVYFINHAYDFAHYNEIQSFFLNMEEEDYKEDWEKLFNHISDSAHILNGIFHHWLNYSHPERYNFFCWEDLPGIIKDWLRYNQI